MSPRAYSSSKPTRLVCQRGPRAYFQDRSLLPRDAKPSIAMSAGKSILDETVDRATPRRVELRSSDFRPQMACVDLLIVASDGLAGEIQTVALSKTTSSSITPQGK